MHLLKLIQQKKRRVAGVMSGTSLDGVDVVLADLIGSGPQMQMNVLGSATFPWPAGVKAEILKNSVIETSSVRDLTLLNVLIGEFIAECIEKACNQAQVPRESLDLIGSHGQTVFHIPEKENIAGKMVAGTLQIGEPAVIANRLNTVVVADFRPADMALGGQGAPLVPYFDYIKFSHEIEGRVLLNIGGISNMTVLAPSTSSAEVLAFDCGPGNMVMDGVTQKLFNRSYDPEGQIASTGQVDTILLESLLADPWLEEKPPKSTGREKYTPAFVDQLIREGRHLDLKDEDVLATATAFTARSIFKAYQQFIQPRTNINRLIVSGGGVHNKVIMEALDALFAGVIVCTSSDLGIDADDKEALAFAVFAHETLNGVATNMPSVTGARRPAVLGKICLPYG